MRDWNSQARNREARLARAAHLARGKQVQAGDTGALLEAVLEPGDRVCLEGNNQKQADFLARALAAVDPGRVHDLHMVQSVLALPEHLDVFERGIAAKLDFSFSGPQGGAARQAGRAGRSRSARSTPISSCSRRYFIDLTPQRRAGRRAGADARRQPLHRPEHRGHAGHRRGDRLQGRHRDRPGQRDRRHGAARRHSRRLGRLRRAEPDSPTTSSRCSRATRRRSPRSRC